MKYPALAMMALPLLVAACSSAVVVPARDLGVNRVFANVDGVT